MEDKGRPLYRGIRTYRDPNGRFLFRYPSDWHQYELADDRDGVMYSPQAETPETWFAVWATPLAHRVTASDADVLCEGVDEGLAQLPGLQVESTYEQTLGNLVRFERVYTFEEDGVRRKRRLRIVYVFKWLFTLVAQGANEDEYAYWRLMFDDCLTSFDLPDALWFASDPELAGDLG